jgi:hypothetical protein
LSFSFRQLPLNTFSEILTWHHFVPVKALLYLYCSFGETSFQLAIDVKDKLNFHKEKAARYLLLKESTELNNLTALLFQPPSLNQQILEETSYKHQKKSYCQKVQKL